MHVRIMNNEATSGTSSLTHFPEPFLALGILKPVGSAKDESFLERAICGNEEGEASDRQDDEGMTWGHGVYIQGALYSVPLFSTEHSAEKLDWSPPLPNVTFFTESGRS